MASPTSLKDLSKALSTFFQAPQVPLPDELNEVISAYLRRHDTSDDASSERLNAELLSIYQRSVADHPDKCAAFLAILRPLQTALRTSRGLEWWDRLIDPVLEHISTEKNLAREALTNISELVSLEEEDCDGSTTDDATLFAERLLGRWIRPHNTTQGSSDTSVEFGERVMREAIALFGKKDPKGFMTALNGFFVEKDYRNRSLNILSEFIQSRPPHLHQILQTPLFGNILQCLQHDDSTTTVSLALVSLILLLPNMPGSLVPFLPTLFNIYARLLFWDRDRSFAKEHTACEAESLPSHGAEPTWEKSLFDNDLDGGSIPHLLNYFTVLYGLYPINFLDYVRKPQRYLRHANTEDDIDVQATEIRDRSERFRQRHILHPNFYTLTIETEKTDFSRWIKSEDAEVIVECFALCIDAESRMDSHPAVVSAAGTTSPPLEEPSDRDNQETPLLRGSSVEGAISPPGDLPSGQLRPSLPGKDASSGGTAAPAAVRSSSQSSRRSPGEAVERHAHDMGEDSPTLPPYLVTSSSLTQLQDMIQSNKVIKSGLHQSHANDSVPSLSLSHQEPASERNFLQLQPNAQPGSSHISAGADVHVGRIQRQNLLLKIDLEFERYMKQQHMAHVGELRRKQIREAATEAETQNLILVNRSLKHRWEEAKAAESQIKKESDIRRNMGKKWESDLTTKLKALREEQKKWKAEEALLRHDLEDARAGCQSLQKLLLGTEEARLACRQDAEAAAISSEEVARLRGQIAQLSASEHRYQGMERKMEAAIRGSAEADTRAEMLSIKLAAREAELQKAKDDYESQLVDLRARLEEAADGRHNTGGNSADSMVESALAASRARQAELQKKLDVLKRKYTLLQSSLIDMQRDAGARETRGSAGPTADNPSSTPQSPAGPVAIRNKHKRGLSDPEGLIGSQSEPCKTAGPLAGPISSSMGAAAPVGAAPPELSTGPSTSPQSERYHGKGGVQNTLRKERREAGNKEEKPEHRKDKRTVGLRGIRGFV